VIAYFGCWGEAGHYLWAPGKQRLWDRNEWPRDYHLDGGILFLPLPERAGYGAITFLPVPGITVLAWWGSPWDKRRAVNSAVMVRGNVPALDAIWAAFAKSFPELAAQLQKPVLLETANS